MTDKKRKDTKERALAASLSSFEIQSEIDRLKKEQQYVTGNRNAVTLVKTGQLRIVLVALRKSARLHEHHVEGPLTLFVLSGSIHFTTGDEQCKVDKNGFVSLDKKIPHDVEALKDSVFILTTVKS